MAHIKCMSLCMLAAAAEASSTKGTTSDAFLQRSMTPTAQDFSFDAPQKESSPFLADMNSDIFGQQDAQPQSSSATSAAIQLPQPKDVATLAAGNSLQPLLALTQTPASQQPQAAISQLELAARLNALRDRWSQSAATPTSPLSDALLETPSPPASLPFSAALFEASVHKASDFVPSGNLNSQQQRAAPLELPNSIPSLSQLATSPQALQPQVPTSFLKKAVMLQASRPVAVPQQQVPEMVRKTMETIDRNGDGLADYAEIAAFSRGRGQDTAEDEFKLIDKDGSGSIDMNELAVTLGVSPVSTEQAVVTEQVTASKPQSAIVAVQRVAPSQTDPMAVSAQQSIATRTAQSQEAKFAVPVHSQTDSDAVLTEQVTTKQAKSAQAAAAFVSSQLQLQMTKDAEAGVLEAAAAVLRAKAAASSRSAEMRTSEAGATAAAEASEGLVKKLAELEAEAEKSEAAAAALRAKSHAEASAAADLMSAAEAAMKGI